MRRPLVTRALVATVALGIAFAPALIGTALAGSSPDPLVGTAANRYLGADACKSCHDDESTGQQYSKWAETKHAKAFETLASERALEIAKERNIEDPQKDDACLKCHRTGFGEDEKAFHRSFDAEKGVQCETCHGPGEDHKKARFKAAMSGETEAGVYTATPEGEIVVSPGKDTCLKCHNEESPTYKPFCFCQRKKAGRHLLPHKPREEADLNKCECKPCEVCGDECPEGCCDG
jgi:hypothetical protein